MFNKCHEEPPFSHDSLSEGLVSVDTLLEILHGRHRGDIEDLRGLLSVWRKWNARGSVEL